ncbi:uncharacterized protein LOC143463211 [Clavelina lepadiformis]|uniref:uncharacterized protein LOC143463211 n=1 Tax=Clavelina lepadiformis TaxID=159417 RepID=UPI0040420C27
MKIFVKVGLLLALIVTRGSAIRCYVCEYSSDTSDNSCPGPNIDDQYLKTCPAGQDHCLTSVSSAGGDRWLLIRGCSPTTAGYSCRPLRTQENSGVEVCCSYCSKDGCNNGNSGSLVQASLVTLLLAMFGALALIKW